MDDKCAICLNNLKEDAVMTLCDGQHCFCFGCMCDYYKTKRGSKSIPCPSCREGDGKVIPAKALIRQLADSGRDVRLTEEENMYKKYITTLPLLREIFPSQFPTNVMNCIITPEQLFIFSRYGRGDILRPRSRPPPPRRQQVINNAKFFITISVKVSCDMVCANAHRTFDEAKMESSGGDFDVSFVVSVSEEGDYSVLYQHKPTILHMTMEMEDYADSLFTSNPGLSTNILEMVAVIEAEEDIFTIQPSI